MRVRSADDRGVVAPLVMICLIMFFGLIALAVDGGRAWTIRRSLVTAADAAALAVAAASAEGDGAACDGAATWTQANSDWVTATTCVPPSSPGAASGTVTVTAAADFDYAFGAVLGTPEGSTQATSTARYGWPSAVSGLRPIGLCIDHPAYQQWLADVAAGIDSSATVYRIVYDKDQPSHCGASVPGNWGLLDLDGGGNSNADLQAWMAYGYDGEVSLPIQIEGDPGAFGPSIADELDLLVGEEFAILVFDSVSDGGGGGGSGPAGANALFNISAFVGVHLHAHGLTGPQANRYLDVSFRHLTVTGTCCGGGVDTGLVVVEICTVDDPGGACP